MTSLRTSFEVRSFLDLFDWVWYNVVQACWISSHDNEESVCGIIYNGFAYYFQKNLQGDVIAITNNKGKVVASYTKNYYQAVNSLMQSAYASGDKSKAKSRVIATLQGIAAALLNMSNRTI